MKWVYPITIITLLVIASVGVSAIPDRVGFGLKGFNSTTGSPLAGNHLTTVNVYAESGGVASGSPLYNTTQTLNYFDGVTHILATGVGYSWANNYCFTLRLGGTESGCVNVTPVFQSLYSFNALLAENSNFAYSVGWGNVTDKPTFNGSSTTDELQFLYDEVATDSGTAQADSNSDTLTIAGSGCATTSASSDTVTIDASNCVTSTAGISQNQTQFLLYFNGVWLNISNLYDISAQNKSRLDDLNASLDSRLDVVELRENATNASFSNQAEVALGVGCENITGATEDLCGPLAGGGAGAGNVVAVVGTDTGNFTAPTNFSAINITGGENSTTRTSGNQVIIDVILQTLGWPELHSFPSACTSSQTITGIAATITCAAISITASQVSDFSEAVFVEQGANNSVFNESINRIDATIDGLANETDTDTNETPRVDNLYDIGNLTGKTAGGDLDGFYPNPQIATGTVIPTDLNDQDWGPFTVSAGILSWDNDQNYIPSGENATFTNLTHTGTSDNRYYNGSCVVEQGPTSRFNLC